MKKPRKLGSNYAEDILLILLRCPVHWGFICLLHVRDQLNLFCDLGDPPELHSMLAQRSVEHHIVAILSMKGFDATTIKAIAIRLGDRNGSSSRLM